MALVQNDFYDEHQGCYNRIIGYSQTKKGKPATKPEEIARSEICLFVSKQEQKYEQIKCHDKETDK